MQVVVGEDSLIRVRDVQKLVDHFGRLVASFEEVDVREVLVLLEQL